MALLKVSKKEFKQWIKRDPSKATIAHRKRKGMKKATEKYEDDKWSSAVRINAGGKCERCGSFKAIQSHHIFGRANKSVRHYLPNGVALCSGHHKFLAHGKPYEFHIWILEKRGAEWWADLVIKSNQRKERFK